MNDGAHIRVRGLRVRYHETEVIHGLEFSVDPGQFVAIVGKSGSGKSTLLHALAGFIPSEGEVQMPADLGMVFQNYAVYPWLTVRDNLAFGLHGASAERRASAVSRLLDLTGLTVEAGKYPAQISGGQAQRVALGRALAPDPAVILMDEPFGALDTYTREKMQTWLLDIWGKENKTVLFVTHNIEEALFLSDRVLVFGRGEILREYPVPFARPRTEKLKFTGEFVNLKRDIVETIERA
jgi:NitT/TauT family transport system ATP-binding protein